MLQRRRVNASAAAAAVADAAGATVVSPASAVVAERCPWPGRIVGPLEAVPHATAVILAGLGKLMPSLAGAERTVEALTRLAASEGLLGAALLVNPEGETLLESLIDDTEGLRYVACDGAPPEWVTSSVVTQLETVASLWLREDVASATQLVQDGALHLRRMTVLRRVESLLTSEWPCATWLRLARTVAVLSEERRHRHGFRPMAVVSENCQHPRLMEARARLLVRVTVERLLQRVQDNEEVCAALEADGEHAAAAVLVWVATTHGLRLFVRQLLRAQLRMVTAQEPAPSRRPAHEEVATAVETNMLQALQRPADFFERDADAGASLLGPLLATFGYDRPAATDGMALRRDELQAETVRSAAHCLRVIGIDVLSERLRTRLHGVSGTLVKSPFRSGLAAGFLTFCERPGPCAQPCAVGQQ